MQDEKTPIARMRIGECRTMKCGQTATIINYTNSQNIDVMFEDGTQVQNRSYKAFCDGHIKNPNFSGVRRSILGKKAIMKNGQVCEVIKEHDYRYIDVRFEDGTTVSHVRRDSFNVREIKNPNYMLCNLKGITKRMGNGEKFEVIEDNGETISIKNEDGIILDHVKKSSFMSGKVSTTPKIKNSLQGQKKIMTNGMECEVIEDFGYKNITIRFSDGTIIKNQRRDAFLSGKIKNPNFDPTLILGKKKMMNCGMECTVIEDFGSENITVQFEDGTIVGNKTRHNFEKGKISNPNISGYSLPQAIIYYFMHNYFPDCVNNYRPSWLRSTLTNSNLEIDIWIPAKRIGIEYDGYQWHKKETESTLEKQRLINESIEIDYLFTILERGAIPHHSKKHINYQLDYRSDYNEYLGLFEQLENAINDILYQLGVSETITIDDELIDNLYYDIDSFEYRRTLVDNIDGLHRVFKDRVIIGQKAKMNCGMECVVIEDYGYDNITVQFEDGTIIKNKNRHSFRAKQINNPNYSKYSLTGEKAIMKNGMEAEIIKDSGAFDITVKFVDGAVVKSCRSAWRKRSIKNPNIIVGSILGLEKKMNCGMYCKVISDNNANDISVEFADGTIINHRKRREFKAGTINNPNTVRNSLIGQKRKMNCGMYCVVIEDNGPKDISVRFEDGFEKHHVERNAFKKGGIYNPASKSIVGQKKTMNCGMECTVISDEGSAKLVVQFADGTILENQRRDTFKNGNIRNPNYDPTSIIGQEKRMNCGLVCKVIEDFGSENITVQFENGIIREKCSRHNFSKGKIAPRKA